MEYIYYFFKLKNLQSFKQRIETFKFKKKSISVESLKNIDKACYIIQNFNLKLNLKKKDEVPI